MSRQNVTRSVLQSCKLNPFFCGSKFTKKFKSSIGATVRNKIWRSFVTEKLHEILCKVFSFDNNIKLAVYLVCILKSLSSII